MIIINQAATLNYKNLISVTPSYEDYKEAYKMISDKTNYNSNKNSEIEASYDFNTTDSYGNIINSNETALPMLKSFPFDLVGSILSIAVDTLGTMLNKKKD
ncbi:unnamed protein product [Macrosiphum euphorbiae]|nr:unnamed protein product [Macrosiphum euphorbiae]CAI6374404.1 unnamed protein product [Macrosiphum euphorbiae]CAI6374407.1 unnamed protein product [Macrosiphum euphorbiae]CAI6374411.1 unnamed protein product [Macrosiphum euphorbiae]CAI6374414.1 unnamed protein product [Macrosiphum euphorbiae]